MDPILGLALSIKKKGEKNANKFTSIFLILLLKGFFTYLSIPYYLRVEKGITVEVLDHHPVTRRPPRHIRIGVRHVNLRNRRKAEIQQELDIIVTEHIEPRLIPGGRVRKHRYPSPTA